MSSFIDDGSAKDEKEGDGEEATAGIEIKFLGNKLRPFIFFSSMGELMSLYWSGASEEKTSALQVCPEYQDSCQQTFLLVAEWPNPFIKISCYACFKHSKIVN